MVSSDDFRTGKHVAHQLRAYLILTPRYRHLVPSARVEALLCGSFREVCGHFGAEVAECESSEGHMVLLIDYPPTLSIAGLVNSLKGVSGRRLRQQGWEEIEQAIVGQRFWSPSYCAVSCGEAPLGPVQEYIQRQNLPPRRPGRPRRPPPG